MNLIGKSVKHKVYGVGEVIAQSESSLEIAFTKVGTKTLIYSQDTFSKFLEAEDPEVQSDILDEFRKAKDAKLQSLMDKVQAKQQPVVKKTVHEKAKDFDKMFGADYNVTYLAKRPVLTYQQVEAQFGIKITGFGKGINVTETAVVLISAIGKNKENFVYHDRWTEEGDYLYSGEGKTGDQRMIKGNLAIKDAEQDGKKIYLLVKFSPQEYYYQGVFSLVDYTYEDEEDEAGNVRKEYKFRLRKL